MTLSVDQTVSTTLSQVMCSGILQTAFYFFVWLCNDNSGLFLDLGNELSGSGGAVFHLKDFRALVSSSLLPSGHQ